MPVRLVAVAKYEPGAGDGVAEPFGLPQSKFAVPLLRVVSACGIAIQF